jgi:hypothetical protein
MYLALLNKENFDKIFELVKFEHFQDNRVKHIMTFLKGYYQVMNKFEIEACIDHLGIEDIKYMQLVLEKSIEPSSVEREIHMTTSNFEYEVLNQNIIRLINRIMIVKESDELSDTDKTDQLKKLNTTLVALKQEQAKLMKALGR